MRLIALIAVLLIALTSPAQTLREVLKTNGIPVTTFDGVELDGNVNAAAAVKDNQVLVVYMQVDKNSMFTGEPKLLQYNRNSGAIVRTEVKLEDANLCCGNPEDITLVDDFAIISFHINPSAETMLVVSKDLKLVTTLYGFDVHQVGSGQVVFIENMIHFAAQHPERLRLADLRTGTTSELYPIKGDTLREQFAEIHAQHMPSKEDCRQNNDPCDPSIFDETIDFLPSSEAGEFSIRVTREATHQRIPRDEVVEVPFQQADYHFQRKVGRWYYCSRELSATRLIRIDHSVPSPSTASCTPDLPLVSDPDAGKPSPFPSSQMKVQ